MFGGFPPATAASISVGPEEPMLRTVTFTPVFVSNGFSAVANPVASAPENSFHTDTVPPILLDDEALATLFTPTTEKEATIAAAVAVTTARFPKNLTTLKFSPIQNQSATIVVSLSPATIETICSPAAHFERITHRSQLLMQ
jgi:hypothetical protein